MNLPYASGVSVVLARVYFYLLFLVPGTLLNLIGYDYSSLEGNPLTKIHVSTYSLILLALVFIVVYPAKRELALYYLSQRLGAIFFFVAATVAIGNIILSKRNGFGMYFDTDLHFFLCIMILPFLSPFETGRLEKFLHVFFAANASLAIIEIVTGWHALPLTTYSPDGYAAPESRPTGLLGHPLHAATLTCAYIVSLLAGGGRFARPWMRPAMLVLQYPSMLAFGGRSAFALTTAILCVMFLWKAFRFSIGARLPYLRLLVVLFSLPLVVLGLSLLGAAGAFDQLLERFNEDGGSARSRLLMLPLLLSFNWESILWGGDPDYIMSEIFHFNLEWGIENPFFHMAILQGVVIATLLFSSLGLAVYDVYRSLNPRALFPIAAFFFLCSGFGSFGGRFITLSIFIIMVSVLFRTGEDIKSSSAAVGA